VGIGTSAPAYKLDVTYGSGFTNVRFGTNGVALRMERGSSSTANRYIALTVNNGLDWLIGSTNSPSNSDFNIWNWTLSSSTPALSILKSNSYVGIGTDAPSQLLHVNGNTRTNILYDNNNTTYYWDGSNTGYSMRVGDDISIGYRANNDADYIYFDANAEYFRWSESPHEFYLSDDLGMGGSIDLNNYNIYEANLLTFNDPGDGEGIIWNGSAAKIFVSPLTSGNSDGYVRIINDGGIVFEPSGEDDYANAMILLSNGYAGIGTTTPSQRLHINGQLRIEGVGSTSSYTRILTVDNNGNVRYRTPGSWAAGGSIGDNDWTISGSNLYSAVSGNVGIGTSGPNAKLDVRGRVKIANSGTTLSLTGSAVTIGHNANGMTTNVSNTNHIALHVQNDQDANGEGVAIGFGVSTHDGTIGAKIAHLRESSYSYGSLAFFTKSSSSSSTTGDYTTERMRINPVGNVGIGTTNPTQKLDVAGNVTATRYYDRNNTGFYADPASTSYFNDMRASIYYDRNNTSYYANPASTSHFNDFRANIIYDRNNTTYYWDGASSTSMRVYGNVQIGYGSGTDYDYLYFDQNNEWLRWNDPSSLFEFSDDVAAYYSIRVGTASGTDNDYLYFDANSEYLRWTESSGEFYLSDDLNIANNLRISGVGSTSSYTRILTVDGNGNVRYRNPGSWTGGGGSSLWSQSGSNVYRSSGNVGIGTSSPSGKLATYINGSETYSIYMDHNANYSGTKYGVYLDFDWSYSTSSTAYGFYSDVYHSGSSSGNIYGGRFAARNYQTGSTRYSYGSYHYVYTAYTSGTSYNYGLYAYTNTTSDVEYAGFFSGRVYASGGFSGSDIKLKYDIEEYKGAIGQVMELKPKKYKFKTREYLHMNLEEGEQIGLLAQEVEQVFPQLVAETVQPPHRMPREDAVKEYGEAAVAAMETDEDGLVIVADKVEFKALNYAGLVPVLVQAIKEQQQMLNRQKQQLDRQQTEIDQLKTANATLQHMQAELDDIKKHLRQR